MIISKEMSISEEKSIDIDIENCIYMVFYRINTEHLETTLCDSCSQFVEEATVETIHSVSEILTEDKKVIPLNSARGGMVIKKLKELEEEAICTSCLKKNHLQEYQEFEISETRKSAKKHFETGEIDSTQAPLSSTLDSNGLFDINGVRMCNDDQMA